MADGQELQSSITARGPEGNGASQPIPEQDWGKSLLHQLKPGLNFTPNFWRADALCAGPSGGLPLGTPLKDAVGRLRAAGTSLPVCGDEFFLQRDSG